MKTISKTTMIILMMTLCTGAFADKPIHQTIIIDNQGCYAVQYTPNQKVHIDGIHKQFRTTVQPLRQSLRAEQAMLRAELLQPQINQKKVDHLVHKIENLRAQILENRVNTIIRIKKVPGSTIILPCERYCYRQSHHPYAFRTRFAF
jgi:hypothetical protein